jgi:hypothetical protein
MKKLSLLQQDKQMMKHSWHNMQLKSQKPQDVKDIEDWNRDRKVKK